MKRSEILAAFNIVPQGCHHRLRSHTVIWLYPPRPLGKDAERTLGNAAIEEMQRSPARAGRGMWCSLPGSSTTPLLAIPEWWQHTNQISSLSRRSPSQGPSGGRQQRGGAWAGAVLQEPGVCRRQWPLQLAWHSGLRICRGQFHRYILQRLHWVSWAEIQYDALCCFDFTSGTGCVDVILRSLCFPLKTKGKMSLIHTYPHLKPAATFRKCIEMYIHYFHNHPCLSSFNKMLTNKHSITFYKSEHHQHS